MNLGDEQDLEPFEPFAFELENEDDIGFKHMHALIGTQRPLNVDHSGQTLSNEFPINHRPISEAAKLSKFFHRKLKLVFRRSIKHFEAFHWKSGVSK